LNNGAKLRVPASGGTAPGDMAAVGPSVPPGSQSVTGVNASFRYVWSKAPLFLRQSILTAYRTSGSASIQTGTSISEPAEDRENLPIRQDPIWRYSLSAPSTGTSVFVQNGQTLTLAPGNYGPTTVSN